MGEEKKVLKKVYCTKCNSAFTYTNKNGIIVCRKCSYRNESKKIDVKKKVKK